MHEKLPPPLSSKRATIELVFASLIWGFGFICTRWALEFAQPFWLNAIRFGLAGSFGLLLVYLLPGMRNRCRLSQFWLALLPGVSLSVAIILQTAGLPYTTITKSGFITVMYIVFVPFLERALLKTKMSWLHYVFVLVALVGSALICNFQGGDWNNGDLITLGCAIVASIQIVLLERFSNQIESPFVFNVFQAIWAAVPAVIMALLFESLPSFPISPKAAWGLAILAFASSLMAFLIQVRTQKVLSSSTVSMLFLLESPFAALFAYFIFGENLSPTQWVGAILILVAASGSVQLHRPLPPLHLSS